MMLSSKSLAERNTDDYPWVAVSGNRVSKDYGFLRGTGIGQIDMTRDPRPEFQHGKLPENRVLTSLRKTSPDERVMHAKGIVAFTEDLLTGDLPASYSLNVHVGEMIHAERVAMLWLTVFA